MTVSVDRDLCIGSGNCVVYAPDAFAQDDEAKAYVLAGGAALDLDAVRTAVEACPTRALQLTAEEAEEGDAPCS
jgi:ferredoxin